MLVARFDPTVAARRKMQMRNNGHAPHCLGGEVNQKSWSENGKSFVARVCDACGGTLNEYEVPHTWRTPDPDAFDPEALEAVIEYFDQRADAEYFTDRASPVPNEAMRHLVAARAARDEIARLTALSAPSRVEDTEVETVRERLHKEAMTGVAMPWSLLGAADLIRRLERERDGYKAMSFDNAVRSSGWMRCHDQLMGWIQDRQAVLNELMDSDPRTAFPSPSDVPELVRRAETAEAKLREARGLALGFVQYVEDYNALSGRQMHDKYGDDPMLGFDNVVRHARALTNPE